MDDEDARQTAFYGGRSAKIGRRTYFPDLVGYISRNKEKAMSDTMLLGVLRMPYNIALDTEIGRIQYYQRGLQAADEIEKLLAENERLRAEMEKLRADIERIEDDAWLAGAKHGTPC